MDGHRACAGISMVLSEEGIVGRAEERLASAGSDASQKDEHHDSGRKTGEHRRHAPEKDGDRRHPLAAETVARHSAERNHERVAEVEDGRDETHLRVSDSE